MSTFNLNGEFIKALSERYPRRADLINLVAEILIIEKDAAYRRLSGKVIFSAQEIGLLARALNISIDKIMRCADEKVWLPFVLESPLHVRSMDTMLDDVEAAAERIWKINKDQPAQMGCLCTSLPLEFYMFSPVLTKLMYFKWGHYFVGTEEFNDYSSWTVPERVHGIHQKLKETYNYTNAFYIWDDSLIWTLAKEVVNFHRMRVITAEERDEIRVALKDILTKLEKSLSGTYEPQGRALPEGQFYVSSLHIGFCCNYFVSEVDQCLVLRTNFSFTMLENCPETFEKMKQWVDSFRQISTLLSTSGRIERKVFFDDQQKLLDIMLS